MRKILLFTGLLLLVQNLISQNLNVASQQGLDISGDMVSINSKVYYLYRSEKSCCASPIALVSRNESGLELFAKNFGTFNISAFGRLIRTNDNCLFMNGISMKSCDTGPSPQFIVKMDTNGIVMFKTEIQQASPIGWLKTAITGITQHPDSSYYLVSSKDLFHYSPSGQFISKITTGLTDITSILALLNDNLLVNGIFNGVRQNVILTTSGSVIAQQPCLNSITKFVETSTSIFALTGNQILEKYDGNLTIQGNSSAALNASNNKICDFVERNDSLFTTGIDLLQRPFYAILSSGLTILYQAQSTYKGVKPTGLALNNKNKICIITTSSSKSEPKYSFNSLYLLNLTGIFNSQSDIGVTGFSNISTKLDVSSNYVHSFVNMDVNVKNFGADTVRSFYLNYYSYMNYGISWCYYLLHKLCQTPIPPGGIISVQTGTFYGQAFYYNSSYPPIDSMKLNMCLFTTVPNESNDIEIDNDAYCDSLVFIVTGVDKNELTDKIVKVFPNPFNTAIHIRSEEKISEFEFYNSLGALMKKGTLNDKEVEINTKELSPGIYFLKIKTEKGTVAKKIVRD